MFLIISSLGLFGSHATQSSWLSTGICQLKQALGLFLLFPQFVFLLYSDCCFCFTNATFIVLKSIVEVLVVFSFLFESMLYKVDIKVCFSHNHILLCRTIFALLCKSNFLKVLAYL